MKGRIAHGMLVLAIATGQANQLGIFEGTTLALLGMDRIRWTAPVRLGDTIHTVLDRAGDARVVQARPRRPRPGRRRAEPARETRLPGRVDDPHGAAALSAVTRSIPAGPSERAAPRWPWASGSRTKSLWRRLLPVHVRRGAASPGRGRGRASSRAGGDRDTRPGEGGPRPLLRPGPPRRPARPARARGSPASIARRCSSTARASARVSSAVDVELVQTDMREFRRPAAYDLALSLFTSFGYFAAPEDDLAGPPTTCARASGRAASS